MHNNYYFIARLSEELDSKLRSAVLSECFTQQKNEIIFVFNGETEKQFVLQAYLGSEFSALNFPENFSKARRNVHNLFLPVIDKKITGVKKVINDRAFIMHFQNGLSLLFKLHGNRANVILFENETLLKVYKPGLKKDFELNINKLNREADFSFDTFLAKGFKKTFFTLGPVVEKYLSQKSIDALPEKDQYNLIQETISILENPHFYITKIDNKYKLSLLEIGEVLYHTDSAIQASRLFYNAYFRFSFLAVITDKLSTTVQTRISKTEEYIRKCQARLQEMNNEQAPEKIADVIMANLHAIEKGSEKVKLYNFYTDSEVEIRLKKDLSPQKYAELLYKKGKNRPLEFSKLNTLIYEKENQVITMLEDLEKIEAADSHKVLAPFLNKYNSEKEAEKVEPTEKFKSFEFMGFKMFFGRNALNNDELTMKFAHKDDLWLHARDVTGTHLIIKHQPGKTFPKPVIEKAASVAAFYSERKNDSLCPVIVTHKKFVRKVKGAPKGAVKVEKETVVLVVPADI